MSYREMMTLECRCGCGETFQTRKSNKKFVNLKHQKDHNNLVQNDKYRSFNEMESRHRKTLGVYKKLMGKKTQVRLSREFLRGAGAELGLMTNYLPLEGINYPVLHDIMIIHDKDDKKYVTLKKITNE
jgi:hypothetical protein